MEKIKPGFRAYLTVLYLVVLTLIEGLLLPFNLALHLVRRKKVTHEISRLIERGRNE